MKRLILVAVVLLSSVFVALWMPVGVHKGADVGHRDGGIDGAVVPRRLLTKLPPLLRHGGEFQHKNKNGVPNLLPEDIPTGGVMWVEGIPKGEAQEVLSQNSTFCERAAYLNRMLGDVQEGYQSQVARPLFFLSFTQTSASNELVSHLGAKGILSLYPMEAAGYGLQVSHDLDERVDPWLVLHAVADRFEERSEEGWSEELIVAAFYKGAGSVRTCLRLLETSMVDDPLSLQVADLFALCSALLPEDSPVRDSVESYPEFEAFYQRTVSTVTKKLESTCISP